MSGLNQLKRVSRSLVFGVILLSLCASPLCSNVTNYTLRDFVRLANNFEKLDLNNDQRIDSSEMQNLRPRLRQAMMSLDLDGDGVITKHELYQAFVSYLTNRTEMMRQNVRQRISFKENEPLLLDDSFDERELTFLENAFKYFDKDQSGVLNPHQYNDFKKFILLVVLRERLSQIIDIINLPYNQLNPHQRTLLFYLDLEGNKSISQRKMHDFFSDVLGKRATELISMREEILSGIRKVSLQKEPTPEQPIDHGQDYVQKSVSESKTISKSRPETAFKSKPKTDYRATQSEKAADEKRSQIVISRQGSNRFKIEEEEEYDMFRSMLESSAQGNVIW